MKPSNLILGVFLICAQAPVWAASGGEATGTRGGGEAIDVNGRPTLRDLVDNSVCDWRSGQEVIGFAPSLQKIFNALNGVHWYYGSLLRRAIVDIKFCFTSGDLIQIDAQDADGLTIVDERGRQAAIRVADRAYVDAKIFMQMTPDDKAYLVAHETMHTFLAFDTPSRNTKLRSTIKSLQTLVLGSMSADSFKLQIQMNQVDWTVTRFDLLDRAAETIREFHADDAASRDRAANLLLNSSLDYVRPFLSLYERKDAERRLKDILNDVPRALRQCDEKSIIYYANVGLDPFFQFVRPRYANHLGVAYIDGRDSLVVTFGHSPVEELLSLKCVSAMKALLISQPFDPNTIIEMKGITTLQMATLDRSSEAVKMLLALPGLNVNAEATEHSYEVRKNGSYKATKSAPGGCRALDYAEPGSEIYQLLLAAGGSHGVNCRSDLRRRR